jgi:hypothetical protein
LISNPSEEKMYPKRLPLRIILLLVVLGCAQLFCGASNQQTPQANAGAVATSVAQTMIAQQTAAPQPIQTEPPAQQPVQTELPAQTEPPPAPKVTEPPVQASSPIVSVNLDTNCRAGPSVEYEKLGFLLPGQTAVVLGRSDSGDWWYIENPRKPGENCWLWGEYATVQGDVAGIQPVEPPPPPAPKAGYVNDDYGFYMDTGAWSYDATQQNILKLAKGEYRLVICYKKIGASVPPCRTGLPAGDWAAGGHFTLAGDTFRKDLLVYQNKVKIASYGGGPIQVGNLELQIWLDSTDTNYDAVDIPKAVLDEVDGILATFGLFE